MLFCSLWHLSISKNLSLVANFKFDRGPEGSRIMDCLEIFFYKQAATQRRERDTL